MPADMKELFRKWPYQAATLIATLALFLITNAVLRGGPLGFIPILLAVLIVVEIFIFVGMEVKEGAQKHGWKHEVVDTIIALAVAVGIWYGMSFVLNTQSPISGVVSCSMLPNLQRGDFVVVQGAPIKAHEISMTQAELDSLSGASTITSPAGNTSLEGSLFAYCMMDRKNDLCQAFIKSPETVIEQKGPFTYHYERCDVAVTNGASLTEPCLKSVEFKGKEYLTNFSNDIIVYQPVRGDLFSYVGDIVHRAMFKIDVDGKSYYLTRGDNNPVLDIQQYDYSSGLGNHPPPQENVRGKVIARIPYLGYFKLFISGYFDEDAQCRTQLTFEHTS
ncbi:hypothetical protein H0O00_05050 [Candidatus Micrarchaeota archaeon]|nr:hypothetical protein [Candidatus Micrarchaeota archaeon]